MRLVGWVTALVVAGGLAGPAAAVTKYTYTYVGNPMTGFGEVGLEPDVGTPIIEPLPPLPGYAFELVIDEASLPGGTLKNADVYFCYDGFGSVFCTNTFPSVQLDGLVSFEDRGTPSFWFSDPVGCASTLCNEQGEIQLSTGPDREVVSYSLGFADNDITAGRLSVAGDSYRQFTCASLPEGLAGTSRCEWSNNDPGTWTVAPIPVPAALQLALAGFGALGLIGLRRRVIAL